MTTKEEMVKILTILAAAWPRFVLKRETITAYYMMLKDIEADALRAAAYRCANNLDFFPSIHELRQAVADNQREAINLPGAYQAWEEILKFPTLSPDGRIYVGVVWEDDGWVIQKREAKFSHPLVEKVAKQLGWPKFPDPENLVADRAHFIKSYEIAMDEAARESAQIPELSDYIKRGAVSEGIKRLTEKLEK